MKNLYFGLVLVLSSIQVIAQITVTNTTFPSIGDTLRYVNDNNPPALDLGMTGAANQVWDFTALEGGAVQTTAWLSPTGSNNAGSFSSANLRTSNLGGATFYRKTNTVLESMGTSGADQLNLGANTVVRYQPPLPVRRAPQKFFDIHTVESDLNWALPTGALADSLLGQLGGLVDSFRFRIHTTRLDVVDAWGTCNIPNGSFPVLREKRTEMTETSIDVHSFIGWTDLSGLFGGGSSGLLDNIGNDTTITYHFFSNTEKEEIAIVTVDNTDNSIQSVQFKYIAAPSVATNDVFSLKPSIALSPNPSSESVQLQLNHFPAGDYYLKVVDAQGKIVVQESVNASEMNANINLSYCPSGLLLIQVLDAKGRLVASHKMVKKH
jgi:hypothetical protein